MPGSLIPTLLSFVASHLVVLTFAGFVIVGGWLFSDRGASQQPALPDEGPGKQAPVVEEPSVSPVTEGAIKGTAVPPVEQVEPTSRVGQGDLLGKRQPQLIGGTLPNYASAGDRAFRPPVADDSWSVARPPSREDIVQNARRAFWNGDFEAAEAGYMDAITRYPDDPDLFGELGNLYHSMGRRERAMDAFYESALRLRAKGELEKLSEVIDLLESQGYPETVPDGVETAR